MSKVISMSDEEQKRRSPSYVPVNIHFLEKSLVSETLIPADATVHDAKRAALVAVETTLKEHYGILLNTKTHVVVTPEPDSEKQKWVDLGPGATLKVSPEDDKDNPILNKCNSLKENIDFAIQNRDTILKTLAEQQLKYNNLENLLQDQIDEQVTKQVDEQVTKQVRKQLAREVKKQVKRRVEERVKKEVEELVQKRLEEKVEKRVEEQLKLRDEQSKVREDCLQETLREEKESVKKQFNNVASELNRIHRLIRPLLIRVLMDNMSEEKFVRETSKSSD